MFFFSKGPPLENGFYYDAYFGKDKKITEEDLEKIDKRIKEIVAQKQPFERWKLTVVLDYCEATETYSRIGLLRSYETYRRIGLLRSYETYSRIGLLRSYENLQSYWNTTKLRSRIQIGIVQGRCFGAV